MQDAYYFCVGGALGLHQSIARPVGYRCLATEVPGPFHASTKVSWRAQRQRQLRQFFGRHSDTELREFLAGEAVTAEPRDPSPGRTPHGLEGDVER